MAAPAPPSAISAGEFDPFTLATDAPVKSPALSIEQRKLCVDALSRLKAKLASHRPIADEFDCLQATTRLHDNEMKKRCSVAMKRNNCAKNRYTDVLPFDSSRVSLETTEKPPSDGYINASFLKGGNSSATSLFIATQGPLPNTTSDFWQMVYVHRCPGIVALTHFDRLQAKCANYLPPDNRSEEFGNVIVTVKTKEVTPSSLELRCLELQHKDVGKPRIHVLHIQMPQWPDHGVPDKTDAVREIWKRLYKVPLSSGPLVVHCRHWTNWCLLYYS